MVVTQSGLPAHDKAWLHTIPSGALLRWRLSFEPTTPMPQVDYPGSMLRGAFGHALKSLACSCSNEEHHPGCIYQKIFDPAPQHSGPARFRRPPPAFVITGPPAGQDNRGGFTFWMTIIGSATAEQALILDAWRLAGRNGFGPGQTRASIVLQGTETPPGNPGACSSLQLEFTSPLFLKRDGRAVDPALLEPDDVVAALARRIALVSAQLQAPIGPSTSQDWIATAKALSLRSDLSRVQFSRYSNRQGKAMPMEGVVGRVWLAGALTPGLTDGFLLGQWLHLGGKTSMGLGGYSLRHAVAPGMDIAAEPRAQACGMPAAPGMVGPCATPSVPSQT